MSYMDNPQPRRRPWTRLTRRPLDSPPEVSDEICNLIYDTQDQYPKFTPAEVAAVLQHDGKDIDIPTVRGVLQFREREA